MTSPRMFDAIVVGAGLTGTCSAREFLRAGLRVALVDAGTLLDPAAFEASASSAAPTELSRQWHRLRLLAQGEIRKAFTATLMKETHSYFVSEHEHPYVSSGDHFNWSRVQAVGGRGHFWGRVLLRFAEDEFARRWPLLYTEIESYYAEVEAALRLGGAPSNDPAVPDGNYQTRRELSRYEREFCAAVLAGRPDRRAVVNHVAEYEPGPLAPMLGDDADNARLELLTDQVVVAVRPRGKRDVEVHLVDKSSGDRTVLKAGLVSLAASAFETTRILLASTDDRSPNGLGNGTGQVGVGLREHLFAGAYAHLRPRTEGTGPAYDFSPFWLNREPTGFYMPPTSRAASDHLASRYGVQGVISDSSGMLYVGAFGEIAPNPRNRMTLDPTIRDRFGRARPTIHFELQPEDRKLQAGMVADIEDMVRTFYDAIGQRPRIPLTVRLKTLLQPSQRIPIGSNHESGGAAMGSDGSTSATTSAGHLWDFENILVCDSATFPSLPPQNPTLTAMALALRTSRLAAQRL